MQTQKNSLKRKLYSISICELSFEMKLISKEVSRAEPEYMNIHPPPPISVLATALRAAAATDIEHCGLTPCLESD